MPKDSDTELAPDPSDHIPVILFDSGAARYSAPVLTHLFRMNTF
jgi:hypothetical protein